MDRGEPAAADASLVDDVDIASRESTHLVVSVRREVVVSAGAEVLEFAPKERSVLAALATSAPGGLDLAEIVSMVWPDGAPETARQAVRNYVMRIRRRAPDLIETSASGYRIRPSVIVDGSGSGPVRPLQDLPESPDVEAHRARLSLQFARDDDDRWEHELDGGPSSTLIEQLEAAVAQEPYRERRWYLLARAHAGLGDRRSALARCDDARRSLAEIGLRPDDRIRDLERRILDDDPALRMATTVESSTVDSARSPIVGIDHLAHRLLDAVAAGRHVAVVGAAGAGKTTLIDEVVARAGASGWRTLSARCSSEPSIPLEPFSELVLSLRERDAVSFDRRSDRAGLGVLFPRLPSVDDAGARGRDRHAMFDDVVNLLVEAPAPTMIVVEDIHWASPSTLGLLTRLIDAGTDSNANGGRGSDVATRRAVVITTAREPIKAVVDRSLRVDIDPWTADVVRSYVERLVGGGDPGYVDAVATWLHDQTSGHPLFVRELAVASITASPVGQSFTPPESVPELVVSAVSNRLDLVARATRSALEVAAMLGAEFDADDIVALVPAGLPRIVDAIDQDIVVRSHGDVFRFRHELFRRVLLEQLAPGRTVELHDVIAGHLALEPSEARHAELAVHAAAARSLDPQRALDALLRSAELHTRQVAWDEAAAQFGEALELIELLDGRSARWCRTAIRAGQCRIGAGSDGGVELLITAAWLAMGLGDQELTATAIAEMCRLGPASEAESVAPDVAAILDEALASVNDPAALAQILGAAAMTYAVADPPRGELYFDQSIALIDRAGGEELRLEVLPLAIICLAGPEHLERREAIADELTVLAERSDDPMVAWGAHHLQMTARVERGDPSIRSSLDGLHEHGERIGSRARQFEREYWSGAVALIDGDLERAEHHTNELSAYVGSIAASRVVAIQGGSLLALRLVDGRAGELLDGVRALADAQPEVGAWHAALAAVAIRAGDAALAATALAHLLDSDGRRLRSDSTSTAGLLCAAEAAAVVGAPEQVAWLEGRLASLAGRWSFSGSGTFGPLDLARARLARAAGDEAASVELARSAQRQALDFGAPLFARIAEDFIG